MNDTSTPPGTAAAPKQVWRWAILSVVAGYLFGLTAVVISRVSSGTGAAVLLKAAPYFALFLVFFVPGVLILGRAWKREEAAGLTPRKVRPGVLMVVVLCAILPFFGLTILLPAGWRPQLDIRNTGAKPAWIVFNERSDVIAPGQSWSQRFSAGDSLTVTAGEGPDNLPGRAVPLPKQNPKPWSFNPIAQRYFAEVNADDPNGIRVENLRYEEVKAPPAPPEPWPQ